MVVGGVVYAGSGLLIMHCGCQGFDCFFVLLLLRLREISKEMKCLIFKRGFSLFFTSASFCLCNDLRVVLLAHFCNVLYLYNVLYHIDLISKEVICTCTTNFNLTFIHVCFLTLTYY